MEDLLQVGAIASTHGVRGEVKVFPTTDEPARFKNGSCDRVWNVCGRTQRCAANWGK